MSGGRRDGGGADRAKADPARAETAAKDVDGEDRPERDSAPQAQVVALAPAGRLTRQDGWGSAAVPRAPRGLATPDQVDSFRELRTRLLTMAEGVGLTHFATLVVPVSSGSGASFVARNLAVAFTLQEQRVAILVDCNPRHPTQDAALGTRADEGGLFDYLEQPRAPIQRLIRSTTIPGLHLIPAGRPAVMPREYFSSQPMRMVMAALRQAPCFPFLDGPPIKGSPDARILSGLVDFVILVAGYGRDTPEAISQAANLFEPTKFAGVVFNERN
ncbi:MAG TPA: CpsD/CapB family tyrosine-protein kinase [Polyangia bacterium]|jgi:protein-tyrosine kinase|nr:CpsD/CapB family tyrosine-protein kinase [Polyangia bacterium]